MLKMIFILLPKQISNTSKCLDHPKVQNKLYLLSIQKICTHFRNPSDPNSEMATNHLQRSANTAFYKL